MNQNEKNPRGKFIVFEGIDGSGKGTQINLCVEKLYNKSKNYDIYLTREPTRLFSEIRRNLRESTSITDNAGWFATQFINDRKEHLQKMIKPALLNGTHVICDRYKLSTLVYQSLQGVNYENLIEAHKGLLVPDLTIVLDCPIEITADRIRDREALDIFEKKLDFQNLLRTNYLTIAKKINNENIVIIDGSQSPNVVAQNIWTEVEKILDW